MQWLHQYEKITFKRNNGSWAGGDAVIYRSWHVVTVRGLRPLALQPHELVATVIEVTIIEEVVAGADETT
jgi:hypothetical protein